MIKFSRRTVGLAIVLCALADMAAAAGVDDFRTIDFSLRFPAALSRFSSYGDVAGFGGASAGSRYASSINPAATDWQPTIGHPLSVSPLYSKIRFENGPSLEVVTEAAGIKTDRLGSFQPAVVQVRNNGSSTGDFLLLDGDYGQIQWGYKFGDQLAVGANFNYSSFKTKGGRAGMLVADGHSDTYGNRFGVLWGTSHALLAGLVVDYSVARATTNVLDPVCGCFVSSKDKTTEVLIRPGLSYEYAEQSSLYIDYQNGRYRNSTGSMTTNRLFFGVEQRVFPWLFARAGAVHDSRGISSPTLGIGLIASKQFSVDIAYQKNMFPELHPEYGRARLFNVSATLLF